MTDRCGWGACVGWTWVLGSLLHCVQKRFQLLTSTRWHEHRYLFLQCYQLGKRLCWRQKIAWTKTREIDFSELWQIEIQLHPCEESPDDRQPSWLKRVWRRWAFFEETVVSKDISIANEYFERLLLSMTLVRLTWYIVYSGILLTSRAAKCLWLQLQPGFEILLNFQFTANVIRQ
jgi:hypothetical protein